MRVCRFNQCDISNHVYRNEIIIEVVQFLPKSRQLLLLCLAIQIMHLARQGRPHMTPVGALGENSCLSSCLSVD